MPHFAGFVPPARRGGFSRQRHTQTSDNVIFSRTFRSARLTQELGGV